MPGPWGWGFSLEHFIMRLLELTMELPLKVVISLLAWLVSRMADFLRWGTHPFRLDYGQGIL